MADSEDILKEFADFMTAKKESESEDNSAEEEVEIWSKDGTGARVKKRDAMPFLKSLGLFPDDPASGDGDNSGGDKDDSKGNPKANKPKPGPTRDNAARRYFAKNAAKK